MNENLQALVARAESEFFPWVVDGLTVETDEQLKNANDLLGIGKHIEKTFETQRTEAKAPILAEGKRIDEEYKPVQARIHLAVSLIDRAVLDFHKKKKTEADALQIMQLQEEAKKIEECKQTGEVYQPAEAIVKPVTQTVHGNMSTTSIVESFDYEIIDDDAIPRELCSGDLKKIKAKHKYDHLPVPGVLITPKTHTVTRLG